MKVFYATAGEGLGHLTKALALMDYMPEHEFHIFTFGKAYEFIKNYKHLHKISGIMFSIKNNKINYPKTLYHACSYWKNDLSKNIEYIIQQYWIHKPDLLITDFEPSLPRAAQELGVPYTSIDSQHMFCQNLKLPKLLKAYSWFSGKFTESFIPNPAKTIVVTFFPEYVQNGVHGFIRKNIADKTPSNKNFILVYVKESVAEQVLASLRYAQLPVVVYGTRKRYNYTYRTPETFAEDLASCSHLISTAGIQLMAEARYYHKQMLVIPETGQYEQNINAHYVEKLGIGQQCSAKNLTPKIIADFLEFKPKILETQNGVLQAINRL